MSEKWIHVGMAGDKLELFINGDGAVASPNGQQVNIRIDEKSAYTLIAKIQEKLDLARKLKVLAAAAERGGE
jgi:hypothetical protein